MIEVLMWLSGAAVVAVDSARAASGGSALFHVLLALAVVIVLGRVLGAAFAYLHQPPVIGEVIAGILIGPSLLGRVAPSVSQYVLPDSVTASLRIVAELGVILYMFLVGMELDLGVMRERVRATVAISIASLAVPFVFGLALALGIHARMAPAGVTLTASALFLGVALSVTAFPVLVRILSDFGMTQTRLGAMAISSAAVADVIAWCLLALVVGIAEADVWIVLETVLWTAAYGGFMLLVVRRVMRRLLVGVRAGGAHGVAAIGLAAMICSALATEWIGVHAIFGAFLCGVIMPRDATSLRELAEKLQVIAVVLFLPAFFASTGMQTEIGLLRGVGDWLLCAAIVAIATLGKFGGSYVAARWCGLVPREAAALGILMNTRGLMELIVLSVGLELGIITPTLYAMLVLMALATTLATAPVLGLLRAFDRPSVAAEVAEAT